MVTKKQKEKRKDFQKQKLKVGKGTPQASNQTNVNFTAKSIQLKQQSIVQDLSAEAELAKYLSLCKHHSNTVRKEAVVYIQQHLHDVKSMKSVISTVAPLVRDQSQSVRDALLELLKKIGAELLRPHVSLIMLHIHSAMTYLQPEIRAQSTRFLDLIVDAAPHEVSRLAFAKTISCFFPLLGWETLAESNKQSDQNVVLAASTATTGLSYGSKADRTKQTHIQSLRRLLKTALQAAPQDLTGSIFHPNSKQLLLPHTSGPFLHLQLFVATGGGNDTAATPAVTEDVADRIAFVKAHYKTFDIGLHEAIKDGGQVGRTASELLEYINDRLQM